MEENSEPTQNVVGPQEMVHSLVSNIFEEAEQPGILGNFIFIGEIIDDDGSPRLMVVKSDQLPDWIARGMLMTAEEFLITGFIED